MVLRRSNFSTRCGADGPVTVAIEWELVGTGAVGADLAPCSSLPCAVATWPSTYYSTSSWSRAWTVISTAWATCAGQFFAALCAPDCALPPGLRWTPRRDVLVSAAQGDNAFNRGTARDEHPAEARRQLMALTRYLLRKTHETNPVTG